MLGTSILYVESVFCDMLLRYTALAKGLTLAGPRHPERVTRDEGQTRKA